MLFSFIIISKKIDYQLIIVLTFKKINSNENQWKLIILIIIY